MRVHAGLILSLDIHELKRTLSCIMLAACREYAKWRGAGGVCSSPPRQGHQRARSHDCKLQTGRVSVRPFSSGWRGLCGRLATMARGIKKHLKRLNAPKHWMLDKLGGVFVRFFPPSVHVHVRS